MYKKARLLTFVDIFAYIKIPSKHGRSTDEARRVSRFEAKTKRRKLEKTEFSDYIPQPLTG
jgi:hypothetical protein